MSTTGNRACITDAPHHGQQQEPTNTPLPMRLIVGRQQEAAQTYAHQREPQIDFRCAIEEPVWRAGHKARRVGPDTTAETWLASKLNGNFALKLAVGTYMKATPPKAIQSTTVRTPSLGSSWTAISRTSKASSRAR